MTLTEINTIKFYEFLNGDITIKVFEAWLYETPILEEELSDIYSDLISFNYRQKDAKHLIEEKIKPYINESKYNTWRIKKLLGEIIENKIDMVVAVRKLRQLYFDTDEKLIPITLGIGYESELDDVPIPDEYNKWEDNSLKEKLKKVDWYRERIIQDSKSFLEELNRREQLPLT